VIDEPLVFVIVNGSDSPPSETGAFGAAPGISIEFVPLSDTTFVMLSNFGALDEESAEFEPQADGSVVFIFHGQPFGVKK